MEREIILKLFQRRVEELQDTNFVKNLRPPKLSLKFDENTGLNDELEISPDEDKLRSFLLTFRQFISNDEPIFLNKIYNLLQINLSDESLKKKLIKSRKQFKIASNSAGLQICKGEEVEIDGVRDIKITEALTPEKITNLLINGHYFHNDLERVEKLKEFEISGNGLIRFNFIEYLIRTTREITCINEVTQEAFDNSLFITE